MKAKETKSKKKLVKKILPVVELREHSKAIPGKLNSLLHLYIDGETDKIDYINENGYIYSADPHTGKFATAILNLTNKSFSAEINSDIKFKERLITGGIVEAMDNSIFVKKEKKTTSLIIDLISQVEDDRSKITCIDLDALLDFIAEELEKATDYKINDNNADDIEIRMEVSNDETFEEALKRFLPPIQKAVNKGIAKLLKDANDLVKMIEKY